jgi:hypothetical protein
MGIGRKKLQSLSDDELIILVKETQKYPIEENSSLRAITNEIYGGGSDDVMHMLTMIPQELIYVLAERLVGCSPHVTVNLDI